ncbi:DUF192 domain-containing protein [Arenibacter sp. BSSL-BM3]|uniref:DUF192 domain-containing protein n=1 Tax=Arenibacter arenosicollis TaxID=2762274 RepID=A0ABR7QIS1_9FLAO|nr:DUF192 domain-containing protein [Arenibacter arenosicollis]MBC8766994.1 DUF192 domain-containing protein [Arenibacter arenosicollis]
MRNNKIYLILVVIFIIQLSCKEENKKVIETAPVTFKKEGKLRILKKESDSLVINLDIEIADTDYERETGLMYRSSMEPNQGMLFVFDDVSMHYFYMKNTEFPLDLIFVDDQMKIASFQKNAQPLNENSLSSKVPVKYVLEVNAGMSDKWSLELGDSISYEKD